MSCDEPVLIHYISRNIYTIQAVDARETYLIMYHAKKSPRHLQVTNDTDK
jgi:hypothetical protein